jgi:hypothetical protein
MSGLGVFNLVAIVAIVGGLLWWAARAAIRGGTRIALDEQAKRKRLVVEAEREAQRQAMLDAIDDPSDRAAVEAVLRRAVWREAHEHTEGQAER